MSYEEAYELVGTMFYYERHPEITDKYGQWLIQYNTAVKRFPVTMAAALRQYVSRQILPDLTRAASST